MSFLDVKNPEDEFAAEVAAYEKEQAEKPAIEPEEAPAPVEAEAPPAPEPKPVVEAKPEKREETIPLATYLAERSERQALAKRIAEFEARASQPAAPQPQQEEIDPNADPIGTIKAVQTQIAEMRQYQQQQEAVQHVRSAYQASAAQFEQTTADFRDAYGYLINQRMNELRISGTPEHLIKPSIEREELAYAHQFLVNGRSPAEAVYQLAKARGYQTAPPPAPPVAEPPAVKPDAAIAAAAEKADAAVSISPGGKQSKVEISWQDGANLKGAAFDSWFEKNVKKNESVVSRMFRE